MTILNHPRAGLAAVLAGLAVATGCQQTVEQRLAGEPGQLPGRSELHRTPRLNATTYFAHGHLLERQGEFERAIVQYRQALELAPDFVSARNRLGIALNKMGQHGLASAEFRRVLETHPHLTYVQNNLGFSYYLEGKYELAEATLRDALSRRPNFPRARMNYGVVLGRLGRFREAYEQFCQAVPEADAYYNVALLQTEAGLYAEAARSLDMALRLNPRLEAARQQLRDISRLAAAQQDHVAVAFAPAADVQTDVASEPSAATVAACVGASGLSAEHHTPTETAPNLEHEAEPGPDGVEWVDRSEIRHEADANPQGVEWIELGEAHRRAAPQFVNELIVPRSPFLFGEDDCDAGLSEEQPPLEVDGELGRWLQELSRHVAELTSSLGDRWCELHEYLLTLAGRTATGEPVE